MDRPSRRDCAGLAGCAVRVRRADQPVLLPGPGRAAPPDPATRRPRRPRRMWSQPSARRHHRTPRMRQLHPQRRRFNLRRTRSRSSLASVPWNSLEGRGRNSDERHVRDGPLTRRVVQRTGAGILPAHVSLPEARAVFRPGAPASLHGRRWRPGARQGSDMPPEPLRRRGLGPRPPATRPGVRAALPSGRRSSSRH